MSTRLSLVLSVTALVVAVLGSTPAGEAAGNVVRVALFAKNAGKVNGISASRTPKASRLVPLGSDAKFPTSVIPAIDAGGSIDLSSFYTKSEADGRFLGKGAPARGALAGAYPNPSIADNAVTSAMVANDSLTGNDISESTLGTVPSAANADNAALLDGAPGTAWQRRCASGTLKFFARIKGDTPNFPGGFTDNQNYIDRAFVCAGPGSHLLVRRNLPGSYDVKVVGTSASFAALIVPLAVVDGFSGANSTGRDDFATVTYIGGDSWRIFVRDPQGSEEDVVVHFRRRLIVTGTRVTGTRVTSCIRSQLACERHGGDTRHLPPPMPAVPASAQRRPDRNLNPIEVVMARR